MRAPILLIGLVALGCDDATSAGGGCEHSRECELPKTCIEGACIIECRRDTDCENGAVCYENECFERINGCAEDRDCLPFGEECDPQRLVCVPPGTARCHPQDRPCPAGEVCENGACRIPVAPTDGAPVDAPTAGDARVRDAASGEDGAPPPDATPPLDQGPPPDAQVEADVRVPGAGQYGDVCACGGDCASGFCVENKLRGTRTCTQLCEDDNGCPSIDSCVQAAAGGARPGCPEPLPGGPEPGEIVGVCIPNETGHPCRAPNDCTEGICLDPPRPANWVNVQSICAATCRNNRKCPIGYSCQEVPGSDTRICAPEVEVSQCMAAEQCGGVCGRAEDSICLTTQAQPNSGYCSCVCRDARDCPTGFACTEVQPGNRWCVAISGYRCPAELEDPNALQCPSFTCLIDDMVPANSRCTAACRNEDDCPRDYLCTPVPGAGDFCQPAE